MIVAQPECEGDPKWQRQVIPYLTERFSNTQFIVTAHSPIFVQAATGANLVVLEPGAWSAQRHWHSAEDEFVYVVEGELALVTDQGEHTLRAGMVAGFPASRADGHHLVNRSDRSASYLEIGTRVPDDRVVYPDIDLLLEPCPGGRVFTNRRGEDY